MWLLTAVGPVNDQRHFAFALERKRTYTVGRAEISAIRFKDSHVRLSEGVLEVEDWNPNDPKHVPTLKWKPEPRKKAAPLKILHPSHDGAIGSTDKADYDVDEVESTPGLYLDAAGQGVELAANCWFIAHWQPLHVVYEQIASMENSEKVRGVLQDYGVVYSGSFSLEQEPDFVITETFKSTVACNYAVCRAVRILRPNWLATLTYKLAGCWKQSPDGDDSFALPDINDPQYQPRVDGTLPAMRNMTNDWLPDPRRKTLFEGWWCLALKAKPAITAEKKYFTAMGANYEELDIVSKPLLSEHDFVQRITPWLDHARQAGVGDKMLAIAWPSALAGLAKAGVDEQVITRAGAKLNLMVSKGNVLWHSSRLGDVRDYLRYHDTLSTQLSTTTTWQMQVPASATPMTPAAPTPAVSPPLEPHAGPSRVRTAAEQHPAAASVQPNAVQSTFPEETGTARLTTVSPVKASTGAAAKRPLRRRAGKAREASLDDFDDMPPPPLPSHTQASQSQPSQLFGTPYMDDSQPSCVPDSVDFGTLATTRTASIAPSTNGRSRLKRRAGLGNATSSVLDNFDTTIIYEEEERKKQETQDEIRQLYERTRADSESLAPAHIFKRRRLQSEDPKPLHTATQAATQEPTQITTSGRRGAYGSYDIDIDEDDVVQRTLRKATKTELVSPAKARTVAEPVEPDEVDDAMAVDDPKAKRTAKGAEVTSDPKFLQAVASKRKKAGAVDDFDKEFELLRILKPAVGNAGTVRDEWDTAPEWGAVNGYDTDIKGNFIEIVRRDLFRKDLGQRKEPVRVDDGRPNFKKFKKKNIIRKEPVQLVLAAPNLADVAEKGQPYWETDTIKRRGTQGLASQASVGSDPLGSRRLATRAFDEDDNAPLVPASRRRKATQADYYDEPLVPRARRKLLDENDDDDDDIVATGSAAPSRFRTQRTQHQTRGVSVVSEASSAGPPAPSTTRTRTRATRGKPEPVVLEDSEDEAELAVAPSANGTGTGTGSMATGKGRAGTRATGSSVPASRVGGTAGTGSAPGTAAGTSKFPSMLAGSTRTQRANGTQRRRLLEDDDDDDGSTYSAVQKKRRLG
ncbi:hypothetical protein Q5752_005186 [Cryptotrichosporon argae]